VPRRVFLLFGGRGSSAKSGCADEPFAPHINAVHNPGHSWLRDFIAARVGE
jgi:hypothetical protein